MEHSFYWHDYESWGQNAQLDRPAQFAGLRTDLALNPIAPPQVFYCRLADDYIPHPEAALITGITPALTQTQGLMEPEFSQRVHVELSQPGTCGAGYNSIRYDDELTRHLFFRNLIEPYGREWQNGNSRWDLIDVLRAAHALRPEGLTWPQRADGATSFRLGDLTAANDIAHQGAHEALADVQATLALARRLRQAQPRLFDYALSLRDRQRVRRFLDSSQPLLHVTQRFPAATGCLSLVLPLGPHPRYRNRVVVFDLRHDPEGFFGLDDEALGRRLFSAQALLGENEPRLPVKTIYINRAPLLAPPTVLTPAQAERWGLDRQAVDRHARTLLAAGSWIRRLLAQYEHEPPEWPQTLGPSLYGGGFWSEADKRQLAQLRRLDPADLATRSLQFEDPALVELVFCYRARNWPDSLSAEERQRWEDSRWHQVTTPGPGRLTVAEFRKRSSELRAENAGNERALGVLEALTNWVSATFPTQ
ncbi:MAG: exodeoxyribonuclease I [Pseudomonadota bacterium]